MWGTVVEVHQGNGCTKVLVLEGSAAEHGNYSYWHTTFEHTPDVEIGDLLWQNGSEVMLNSERKGWKDYTRRRVTWIEHSGDMVYRNGFRKVEQ